MKRFCLLLSLSLLLFLGRALAATPLYTAFFGFDSDRLSPADRAGIERLAQRIDERPLVVSGHTDDSGPAEYNAQLALRRAKSVYRALVSAGYPADLIEIEARPSERTDTGKRQTMRRVEIRARNDAPAEAAAVRPSRPVDPLRVGRYSEVAPVPDESQLDPLRTLVRISFPVAITRVGAALDYLMARSGWRLAEETASDPAFVNLLQLPLPETQRRLGPVPLIEAVRVLCGPAYEVVVDPVHRLLSCELKAEFAVLYQEEAP